MPLHGQKQGGYFFLPAYSNSLAGQAIREAKNPPAVWINGASATIYRHAEDHYQDEKTGEMSKGFSVQVCQAWEKTFLSQETGATKKLVASIGLVLGNRDGVFPRLLKWPKSDWAVNREMDGIHFLDP